MGYDSKTKRVVDVLIKLHNVKIRLRNGIDEFSRDFCKDWTDEIDNCVLKLFDILFEYPPKEDIIDTLEVMKKNNPKLQERINEIIEPIMIRNPD